MNIDYTVVALMFPAIPLIMNVYSTRFHTLSALIRKIHDEYVFEKHTPPEWKDQLKNLNDRIGVLKYSIMFGAFGVLFNMVTVFALYLDELFIARIIFGSCCLSIMISIIFFIREIQISTNALKLIQKKIKINNICTARFHFENHRQLSVPTSMAKIITYSQSVFLTLLIQGRCLYGTYKLLNNKVFLLSKFNRHEY